MRQFTPWAQAMGGFLHHHRIGGFLTNLAEVAAVDEDATRWRGFLATWHTRHGSARLSAAQLRRDGEPDQYGTDGWGGLFITTGAGKTPNTVALGRLLTGQIGRWRGDFVLRSALSDRGDRNVFWVEHAG